MTWIGWTVAAIIGLNTAFFGALFIIYEIERRGMRK